MLLWAKKVRENDETASLTTTLNHAGMRIVRSAMVGEVHIALSRLFTEELARQEQVQESNYIHSPGVPKISAKLFLHGDCVGSIKGSFFVQNKPFVRHLVCGVRTENGIAKSGAIFMNTMRSSSEQTSTSTNWGSYPFSTRGCLRKSCSLKEAAQKSPKWSLGFTTT